MSVFAIADLHLPGHNDKPMNVFGMQWDQHFQSIQQSWRTKVREKDIVLIPGDISWAMQLSHAQDDLEAIAALPGQKILLRGNHDYWWSSITKVRSVLPPTMYALQNDALLLDGHVFCGTRGWALPTMYYPLGEEDRKVFERELIRLELSLDAAAKLRDRASVTVMMHFPPLLADGMSTAFTKLLEARGVQRVVYGHLHGAGIKNGFIGKRNGIDYFLVSCDAVQFSPMCIIEEEGPPYL